jgi:hypothetical protein
MNEPHLIHEKSGIPDDIKQWLISFLPFLSIRIQ